MFNIFRFFKKKPDNSKRFTTGDIVRCGLYPSFDFTVINYLPEADKWMLACKGQRFTLPNDLLAPAPTKNQIDSVLRGQVGVYKSRNSTKSIETKETEYNQENFIFPSAELPPNRFMSFPDPTLSRDDLPGQDTPYFGGGSFGGAGSSESWSSSDSFSGSSDSGSSYNDSGSSDSSSSGDSGSSSSSSGDW